MIENRSQRRLSVPIRSDAPEEVGLDAEDLAERRVHASDLAVELSLVERSGVRVRPLHGQLRRSSPPRTMWLPMACPSLKVSWSCSAKGEL